VARVVRAEDNKFVFNNYHYEQRRKLQDERRSFDNVEWKELSCLEVSNRTCIACQ